MAVDVAEFTTSNRAPTGPELEELKTMLAPDELLIAQLEEEIRRHEEEIKRLAQAKAEVYRKIHLPRFAASWIRRMPVEIMGAIFLHAVQDPRSPWLDSSFGGFEAPLVLLRVCKSWRDIALETPALWADMDLSIPRTVCGLGGLMGDVDEDKKKMFEDEVGRWLQRSASLPLTIRVRCGYRAQADGMGLMHKTLLKLAEHCHRWEHLETEATPEVLDVLKKNLHLPLLKSARITDNKFGGRHTQLDWAMSVGHPAEPISVFHCQSPFNSPLLQELTVSSDVISCSLICNMPVKWEALTVLTLTTESDHPRPFGQTPASMGRGLLPVLARCINVRQCLLSLPRGHVPTEHVTPVRLPSLTTLSLRGCCIQMDAFLNYIDTPAVRELHYYPSYDATEHVNASFINFLRAHGDQIRVLAFEFPTISSDDFLSCLSSIPFATELSIGPHSSSLGEPESPFIFKDSDLLALMPKHEGFFLCPKLELLRCSYKASVTVGAVKAFIRAKTDPDLLETASASKLRGMSVTRLPSDWPVSNPPLSQTTLDKSARRHGYAATSEFEDMQDAGVVLDLFRPIFNGGSSGPSLARWEFERCSSVTKFIR